MMMILSNTTPGCQGEADYKKLEAVGRYAYDGIVNIVSIVMNHGVLD